MNDRVGLFAQSIYLCLIMAGIYIHIPFCRQKCHYCNFFSVATLNQKDEVIKALLNEIGQQKDYLGGEKIETIYLGGGTPSLLNPNELNSIFEELGRYHNISEKAEITLEANPDDLSPQKATELRNTPVNRLSIGIQSFFDDDLHYLNRVHNASQARDAIKIARDAGFENLTIDLIYGIPTLSHEKWLQNLNEFFSLNIPHLSAYALTVEEKTALFHLIRKKKAAPVDEVQSAEQFKILMEQTREHGYIHYEISNFSLEGYYSKHNSLYWLGGNYLGLGPSAHSFNGSSRQWNLPGINSYIVPNASPNLRFEKEILTLAERYNEYVMTSLRTSWGCDPEHILHAFGSDYYEHFRSRVQKFLEKGQIIQKTEVYYLTDEGKLFADGIASDLFAEE